MQPKDITRRVLRRPLHSPYLPGGGVRRSWRWLWVAGSAWLLWVAVLSDHSFWRILRLRQELSSAQSEIKRVQAQGSKLDAQLNDPRTREEHAEEVLRRQGLARPGEIVYRLGGSADSTAH